MSSRTPPGAAVILIALAVTVTVSAQTPDPYDAGTVRALYLTFKQNDWWDRLVNNRSSRTDIPADLSVDSHVYPNVGVRFKSHASYHGAGSSVKKPFNISMDAFVPNQRLYGIKTLNLQNGFLDPTYVREVITLEMMRRYHPAPRANFVKLYINKKYWGLYVNVEQVNRDFIRRWFARDDGNNYKADPPASSTPPANSALVWLGQDPGAYQKYYELKTGTVQPPWTDLVNLIDKLNNTQVAKLEAVLPAVLDVDRALWFLATSNVFCNLDSYIGSGHNYYLYHGVSDDRFHLTPWDLNRSFGGFDMGKSLTLLKSLSPYFGETNAITHPLVNRLLSVGDWRAQYVAHVRTVVSESFQRAALDPLIKRYQDLIRSDVQADPNKLYTMSLFDQSVAQDVRVTVPGQSTKELIPGLKPFVDGRAAWLGAHPDLVRSVPTITEVTHAPARPWGRDPVWITARIAATGGVSSAVLAYAAAPGPFTTLAMLDDGNHHDGKAGDGVYGNAVPPHAFGTSVRYYLHATATAGGRALDPPRAEMTTRAYRVVAPPARINEFVASNLNGIRDEKNEREDWIEFLNTTASAFDLSGCYLTDTVTVPTQWRFPTGSVVPASGAIIVWADNDPGQGSLHATFKLAKEGETIAVFDTDGKTLLDTFVFSAQTPDVSTGRTASEPTWVTYPSPTPYRANAPVNACGHLAYDGLDPGRTGLGLTAKGTPSLAGRVTYLIDHAPASTPGFLGLSPAPLHVDLGSLGALLLHPAGVALIPVVSAGDGTASVPLTIPNVPALRGFVFYLQAFVYDGIAARGGLSNGVMTQICP
jgi:hypothetical protein